MDNRGWISIPLLASFNRVKNFTTDVNLVREVLHLSSLAQVKDDWVRMGGWEQYVLPNAAESAVEPFPEEMVSAYPSADGEAQLSSTFIVTEPELLESVHDHAQEAADEGNRGREEGEEEEDDDDEDEVEIVLGPN
jgi:la-related protein 1